MLPLHLILQFAMQYCAKSKWRFN